MDSSTIHYQMREDVRMRMAELSRRSGVPVPTIKFYLRDGLLPDGERTAANQASYDETHLERLRLIRALVGPGRLSLAATKDVLTSIDQPPDTTHDLLGRAQSAITPAADGVDLTEVHGLMEAWGWAVDPKDCDTHAALAVALNGLRDAGFEPPDGTLDAYAAAMRELAEMEVDHVPTESATAAVRYVVLGTVLIEPVLLALRRLAQQDASYRRFETERRSDA